MNKEIYIEQSIQTSINITNTYIDSIRNKDITRTGYRVYQNGLIGVAGAIGEIDEMVLEQEAKNNLLLEIPYEHTLASDLVLHCNDTSDTTNTEQIIKDLEDILTIVRNKYPDFIISNQVGIEEETTSLSNNLGLDLSYTTKVFFLNMIVREITSINILDTGIGAIYKTWDKEVVLKEIDNMLSSYRNQLNLPIEEKVPVIFMGGDERLILSKLLSELNGDKVGTGASLLKDFIGQEKFNNSFSLYQDRSSLNNIPFFDSEGTIQLDNKFPLIENGVILHAYTDKQTASKYNLPLTGSAGASYDSVPSLTVPPFSVGSSGKSLKELLNGKLGLAIVFASGGDYTPDGKFATPVQLAMLTDGERFLGRVPEFELSGDLYELFGQDFIGRSCDTPFSGMHGLVLNMKITK